MAIRTFIARLLRTVHELRAANAANVTITFALSTIPLVGFVGAAVDYSHGNSVKTSLQAATDAAALMLSKNAATWTNAQIQTKATDYVTSLFNRPEATGLSVTATYNTSGGSQILVVASANVKTNFMGLLGFNTMRVGADSQVKWGNTRLRVALVLDNTGSMADNGKMTALKAATSNLLDQFKVAAATNGDIYVSIIPFAKDVNVGAGNYQTNWIDWTDWENENGTCASGPSNNKTNCQGSGKNWTPADHSTWNGCVTDRGNSQTPNAGKYDTNVNLPQIGNPAVLFPAEQYASCPQSVMPLSYDWASMKNLVAGMSPSGMTNQAIGLVHGWQSLVGGGPYPTPPTMDTNYTYSQVIILLTDGLNTEDRWFTDQDSIDNRQTMTCNNIKATGITIYTIQVNTSGDPTSTLLQTCATDSSKFFLLTSANEIVSTFQQIGIKLSHLRIAQ